MDTLEVNNLAAQTPNGKPMRKRFNLKMILAFFAIYVIWGSTFLAIRIAVLAAPPWFCAGVRFFVAGTVGFCGVGMAMFKGGDSSFGGFGVFPGLVILGGSASWSLGAVLTRSLPLPKSRVMTAGAEMMLGGATLLMLSLAWGELRP